MRQTFGVLTEAFVNGLRGKENGTDYATQVFAFTVAASFAASVTYSLVYYALGDARGAAVILSMGGVALAGMARYRQTASAFAGTQVLSAGMFVVLSLLIYFEGGLSSPVGPWLLIVPLPLLTAGAPRAASAWFVLSCIEMGLLAALELNDFHFPASPVEDLQLLFVVSQIGLCTLVFLFLLLVDRARRVALQRFADKNLELATARDAAMAAVRVKSQFLANMSHEIRTPLNGVMGTAELLATTRLTPEQAHLVRTMKGSGHNLLALINDVLDFSKIEANKLELERVAFDLHEVVASVCELLAPRAAEKQLEFTCHIAARVPRHVLGDPVRVRQILTNLLGNAIKFTHEGEIGIEVDLTGADADADADDLAIRCTVFDTGVGIGEDQRERLFRAFTQADGSTTRNFGGSGLGLAIAADLARLMNGRIDVDSVPGEGSTFTCFLTLGIDRSHAADAAIRDSLAGREIVVVEPHPRAREILVEQLAALGAAPRVLPYPPTPDQLRAALSPPPDILFLAATATSEAVGEQSLVVQLHTAGLSGRVVLMIPVAGWHSSQRLPRIHGATLVKPVRPERLRAAVAQILGPTAPSAPTVSLPLPRPTAPTAAPDPDAGRDILLVEDNPVNQHLAQAMLSRLGCTVVLASDGAAAVEAFSRHRFDLVFMDCQMPVMDGFEATREIRRRELAANGRRAPIVALTANALAGDRERCLAAGMDDHLGKPFTLAQIAGALDRWLPAPGAVAARPDTA